MSTESRELLDNWARHYSISPSAMEALHSVLSTREALAHSRAQDSGGETVVPAGWCTLGVGDGSGGLFVYGPYEAIKACQRLILAAKQPANGDLSPDGTPEVTDDTASRVPPDEERRIRRAIKGCTCDSSEGCTNCDTSQPSDPADAECDCAARLDGGSHSRDCSARVNPWKEAVIDELLIAYIYSNAHDTNPKKAVHDVICWNIRVALDPAVSEDARTLIEQGRLSSLNQPEDNSPTAQRHDEGEWKHAMARQLIRMADNITEYSAEQMAEKMRQAAYCITTLFSVSNALRDAIKKQEPAHGAGAAVEAVDAFGRTGPLLEGWDRLAREEGRPGHSRLTWAQAAADLRQVQMRNAALSTQPLLSDQPAGVSNGKEANDA